MHLLRPLSLSALLIAASSPALAAESGTTSAEALPAPQAPALQVEPTGEDGAAAALPSVAAQTAATAPALQAPVAPSGTPATAAPTSTTLPALPGGTAGFGGLIDPQTLALLDQLRALQVTPQQAVGGVGALLGLAQSQLAADQYAQLSGAVPGLALLGGSTGNAASTGNPGIIGRLGALSGLLGGNSSPAAQPASAPAENLAGVGQAFSVLGMDTGLVGSFGQTLLQFLAGQGLAGALLQSLGGIWGVPGVPGVPAVPGVAVPAGPGVAEVLGAPAVPAGTPVVSGVGN